MLHNKERCELRLSEKFNGQTQGLGATRSNILRLLRSLDLVGWSTHEESGRIDRKAFTRFSTGSTAIFSKREHVEAYAQAYDTLGSTRATIISNANKLMKDPRISMQLESVLEATKQNVIDSDAQARQYVMRKLFDQVNDNTGSESGRLRSLELIGKAVGMFTDRVETTVEQVDTETLKKELQSHLHLITDKKKVVTIQ